MIVGSNCCDGITIQGSDANGNVVQGNYIGLDATGSVAFGNSFQGIAINGATDNRIGGTDAAARNVIVGAQRFAGVAIAIGVPQPGVDANVLLGDFMVVGGGALWAASTLVVKTTALIKAPAEKGLGYQVAVSIPILGFAAWIFGETLTRVPGPLALSLMVYQSIWVVGLTFLIWFALVKTYSASKLSAFTFITPLFGVVASYLILHDNLTPAFGAAALLVIAGLYLVNRPGPAVPAATDPLLNVTKT